MPFSSLLPYEPMHTKVARLHQLWTDSACMVEKKKSGAEQLTCPLPQVHRSSTAPVQENTSTFLMLGFLQWTPGLHIPTETQHSTDRLGQHKHSFLPCPAGRRQANGVWKRNQRWRWKPIHRQLISTIIFKFYSLTTSAVLDKQKTNYLQFIPNEPSSEQIKKVQTTACTGNTVRVEHLNVFAVVSRNIWM